jgi:hypothetical protein
MMIIILKYLNIINQFLFSFFNSQFLSKLLYKKNSFQLL